MRLYDVLVFVHIAVLVSAFLLTGAIHASEWLTARAGTVQEMRVLASKINEDLAKTMERKTKSQLRKPDWI